MIAFATSFINSICFNSILGEFVDVVVVFWKLFMLLEMTRSIKIEFPVLFSDFVFIYAVSIKYKNELKKAGLKSSVLSKTAKSVFDGTGK